MSALNGRVKCTVYLPPSNYAYRAPKWSFWKASESLRLLIFWRASLGAAFRFARTWARCEGPGSFPRRPMSSVERLARWLCRVDGYLHATLLPLIVDFHDDNPWLIQPWTRLRNSWSTADPRGVRPGIGLYNLTLVLFLVTIFRMEVVLAEMGLEENGAEPMEEDADFINAKGSLLAKSCSVLGNSLGPRWAGWIWIRLWEHRRGSCTGRSRGWRECRSGRGKESSEGTRTPSQRFIHPIRQTGGAREVREGHCCGPC